VVEPSAGRTHRILSALAAASILAGLRTVWLHTTTDSAGLGLVVSLGYAGLLTAVVVSLVARRRRTLVWVDQSVLLIAICIEAVQFPRFTSTSYRYPGDEGILTWHAIDVLRHGHDPYRYHWAGAVAQVPTQLMNGRVVDRFVYPPVSAVLGAGLDHVSTNLGTPSVLAGLALIATALVLFLAFPVPLRPLAVLVVFGIAFETARAVSGAPGIIAVPLLAGALWRWPQIARGGRLGTGGVVRALCLGLALATYQLSWFLLPFVAVALWRVRRDGLASRPAALAVLRYVAIAVAVFAVVNAPFAIAGFSDWWHGLTGVLTEHALIYGPGIAMISGNLLPGSGALDFFTYAAALAYLALLVAVAAVPARLAAASVVLPIVVFWLAIRSEDTYYVVFAPLWVLAVVTATETDFSGARPLSFLARLDRRWKMGLLGASISAVVACLATALATPSPLQMTVVSRASVVSARTGAAGPLQTIGVLVHNRSTHIVRPSFLLLGDAALGEFWTVQQGPAELRPGQSATYQLRNPDRGFEPPARARLRLEAVSDHPQTLSSVGISR